MNKAYSVLQIKTLNDDARTFTGIASTPSTDRQGDIVEPKGAQYNLPIPLLWQHRSSEPIGNITSARVTANGIEVTGQLVKIDEPPSLKDDLDRAWAMIKAGLVRGLSIGFNPIEFAQIKDSFGLRFTKWEWLELSAVTIPANQEASIQTIKTIDQAQERAASGAAQVSSSSKKIPGVSGSVKSIPKGNQMKTFKEQIAALEAKRAASTARMTELAELTAEEGRTFDASEAEEYDGLNSEVDGIDKHLTRIKGLDAASVRTPVAESGSTADVTATKATSGAAGNTKGAGIVVMGKSNLPKGTAFVRMAMITMASNGDDQKALQMARRFKETTPEVESIFRARADGWDMKTAVAAGTTTDATWASPLVQYQNLSSEFVELLRPETVVGKIAGLRRVPFNVRIPAQSTGVSAGWVGQGAPKPVGKPGFTSATMDFSKIAVIVAMTEELVRFSTPSAEELVRNDMISAIAQFTDEQFLSPGVAAVANVSPASVTNGLTPVQASGTTIAAITTDMKSLFAKFTVNNIPLNGIVLIMHPNTALSLSLARTTQDIVAFPGLDVNGGTFFGIPVITSASVPSTVSGGTMIFALKPSEIFLADDGQVVIDMSREASVQMNDAPSAGAQSLTSFWQNNLVGLRAERFINWQRRRTGAVAYIDNVAY